MQRHADVIWTGYRNGYNECDVANEIERGDLLRCLPVILIDSERREVCG